MDSLRISSQARAIEATKTMNESDGPVEILLHSAYKRSTGNSTQRHVNLNGLADTFPEKHCMEIANSPILARH